MFIEYTTTKMNAGFTGFYIITLNEYIPPNPSVMSRFTNISDSTRLVYYYTTSSQTVLIYKVHNIQVEMFIVGVVECVRATTTSEIVDIKQTTPTEIAYEMYTAHTSTDDKHFHLDVVYYLVNKKNSKFTIFDPWTSTPNSSSSASHTDTPTYIYNDGRKVILSHLA